MPILIPPYLSDYCKSPGERFIFDSFQKDSKTDGWVILHSLNVAKHTKRISGEIDFVVIIPRQGVLCIEVKAGNVARKRGIWKYSSGPFAETSKVGPFKQASEAMHEIRDHVGKMDSSLKKVLFFSGVFFTFIDFDQVSTEWHPWQFVDRSMISKSNVSKCCMRIIKHAHKYIENIPSAKWYDKVLSRPNSIQVKRIANVLRNDFEYYVSPRIMIEESEHKIFQFTSEQYDALDSVEENERILFKGPAGTGKTFLAIESVNRAISRNDKVLFICYNYLLGNWLKSQFEGINQKYRDMLTAGTMHSIFISLSGLRLPNMPTDKFWEEHVPNTVLERILNGNIKHPVYDKLIVDEAQDILKEPYLDVLDLLLAGGLSNGRALMFGDFERQAIYSGINKEEKLDGIELLEKRHGEYFSYALRINCRNAKHIAIAIELTSKMVPGYKRILHTEEQKDIFNTEIEFFRNEKQQVDLLRNKIKKLSKSFKFSDIKILSPKHNNISCAYFLSLEDRSIALRPLRNNVPSKQSVEYSTIHAFKGLESPAIIITDIKELSGASAESLLYVGMSRARLKLIMLMHESCRDIYLKTVREGFEARMLKGEQ